MNRALPIEKLRGVVFSAPLSPQYYQYVEQIGMHTGQDKIPPVSDFG